MVMAVVQFGDGLFNALYELYAREYNNVCQFRCEFFAKFLALDVTVEHHIRGDDI